MTVNALHKKWGLDGQGVCTVLDKYALNLPIPSPDTRERADTRGAACNGKPNSLEEYVCRMQSGDGGLQDLVVHQGALTSAGANWSYIDPVVDWPNMVFTGFNDPPTAPTGVAYTISDVPTRGGTFEVVGSNMGRGGELEVSGGLGSNAAVVSAYTTRSMTIQVPRGEGTGKTIKLNVHGLYSNAAQFSYKEPTPETTDQTSAADTRQPATPTIMIITGDNFGSSTIVGSVHIASIGSNTSEKEYYFPMVCDTWDHTEIRCEVPEGAGKNNSIFVNASGNIGELPGVFSYPDPTVLTTGTPEGGSAPLDPAALPSISGYTSGGTSHWITGEHFGPAIGGDILIGSESLKGTSANANWTHDRVDWLAPSSDGSGGDVDLFLRAGNNAVQVGTFSYYPPQITGISPQGLSTRGNGTITISGSSFGYRIDMMTVMVGDQQCVQSYQSHTEIHCLLPRGTGFGANVTLSRNGVANTYTDHFTGEPLPPQAAKYSYGLPTVTNVASISPRQTITVRATNLDYGLLEPGAVVGNCSGQGQPACDGVSLAASIQGVPCASTSWHIDAGSSVDAVPDVYITCQPHLFPAHQTVVSMEQDISGSGTQARVLRTCTRNLTTSVAWSGLDHEDVAVCDSCPCKLQMQVTVDGQTGPGFNFSFPQPILGQNSVTRRSPNAIGEVLKIEGPGPLTDDGQLGNKAADSPPITQVMIGGQVCLDKAQTEARGDIVNCPDCGWSRGDVSSWFNPFIKCHMQKDVVGSKSVDVVIDGVGFRMTNTTSTIMLGCKVGYYGATGENCLPCPEGAVCLGEDAEPYSELGWWMTKLDNDPPSDKCKGRETRKTCPYFIPCDPPESCQGGLSCGNCNDQNSCSYKKYKNQIYFPNKADVPFTADNTCQTSDGMALWEPSVQDPNRTYYTDEERIYQMCYDELCCAESYRGERCALCANDYYRLGGECIICPDNPWLVAVGLILVACGCAVAGWMLQRNEINVGLLSIGIDYFQVVAMFAQTKISWPPAITAMYTWMSAFNLNLELMAPECSFEFDFESKWSLIQSIPLIGFAIFMTLHWGKWFHKRCIKNRRNKLHTHIHTMIGTCITLLYYGYLYLVRTNLDIFNCGPTEPDDGFEYLQVVFVACNEPGGLHLRLLPWAVVCFIAYGMGYPALIAYILMRGRQSAVEDQLLRAANTGTSRKTNPNCYDFRKRYHKMYYNFKPDFVHWILVILCRKFFIAVSAIIFRRNATFQMAMMLMVLFASYATHVVFKPYMSTSEMSGVLELHARRIAEAEGTAYVPGQASAGGGGGGGGGGGHRPKGRKALKLGDTTVPTMADVTKNTAVYFFNYNTVEAVMLASAILICLSGIMFNSGQYDNHRYEGQQSALTAFVLFTMIATVIYWLTVLITEIVVTLRPDLCAGKDAPEDNLDKDEGFDMQAGVNPLHIVGDDDAAAEAHKGRAQAEASLERHQEVIEQQSNEILELKKKVQAAQLTGGSSRRMKKNKPTVSKTKKAFSPMRGGEDAADDDFMGDPHDVDGQASLAETTPAAPGDDQESAL
jgi:hypothetical protein